MLVACGESVITTEYTTGVSSDTIARSILECPQGPASDETPQYGGTLVLIHYVTPTNIGAFWLSNGFADNQICRYALENLIGLDSEGNPVPQLATSWDIDEEAMTITFHLREGVKFHDGTDFNADAVKWNFDQWRFNSEKRDLKKVSDIEVLDEHTVRLSFTEWDPIWLNGLSPGGTGRMVSPTAVQNAASELEYKRNPKGTGPFEVVEWNPKFVKFKRFDDYWQEGLPYLDGVEVRVVVDSMSGFMSLRTGEADALYGISPANAAVVVEDGYTVDSRVFAIWSIAGDSLSEDCPFSDQMVREGMAHAIDVETLVTGVYGDVMFPTDQLAIKGMQAYNPDIVGHEYNVEKAKQLLADSKFNISVDNPWTVPFTYIVQAGDEAQVMTVLQEYLSEVGIILELTGFSFPAQKAKAENGYKNELILMDLSYNGLEMQYSTALMGSFSEDRAAFGDTWIPEEFNEVYRQMLTVTDPEGRELLYQELNRIAVDDFCLVVPFMGNQGLVAKAPWVHDYGYGDTVNAEFLPERIWLSR